MNDTLERSRPMSAYADTYGEPDIETTSRMRSRILGYMEDRAHSRQRVRHWVQAAVVTGVLAVVAGGAWLLRGDDGAAASSNAGVIATVEQAQEVELQHGGSLRLLAHSGVRVTIDAPDATLVELLEGEVEIFVEDPGERSVLLRSGDHEIDVQARRVSVRRTRGVPLVTVHEGHVRLRGPDLPPDGVRISPAD